ncbi:unnamed protein product [Phaeothamnion confervicola]
MLGFGAVASIGMRMGIKHVTKAGRKRVPLHVKRAPIGYYKGNQCRKEGRLTSKGRFLADPERRLEIVAPDLTGFKLLPYVAPGIMTPRQRERAALALNE